MAVKKSIIVYLAVILLGWLTFLPRFILGLKGHKGFWSSYKSACGHQLRNIPVMLTSFILSLLYVVLRLREDA